VPVPLFGSILYFTDSKKTLTECYACTLYIIYLHFSSVLVLLHMTLYH
jgi:hypothetical protein